MGNFLFPLFAFGCLITGIVVLGVIQARDNAKLLKGDSRVADTDSVRKEK
jgi:hypothetical protein